MIDSFFAIFIRSFDGFKLARASHELQVLAHTKNNIFLHLSCSSLGSVFIDYTTTIGSSLPKDYLEEERRPTTNLE